MSKSADANDMSAMREALANLVDVIDRCDSGSPLWWHCGAKGVKPLKDAKAALSAPRRNCEVGTAKEQAQRFYNFCAEHSSAIHGFCDCKCPCIDSGDKFHCLCKWEQMPYKEGGL